MKRPLMARIAWLVAGLVVAVSAVTAGAALVGGGGTTVERAVSAAWSMLPALFAFNGALIVSRQPGNVIGWLFLGPAMAMTVISPLEVYLASIETAPAFSIGLFLALTVVGLSWLWLIFPLFHLLQVFPTGKVLGRGWRWLTWLEVGMLGVIVTVATFTERIGPTDGPWTVASPLGFIPESFFAGPFMAIWTAGLLVLAVGGMVSSIVRYRRAALPERHQLKLVLYTITAFALVYAGMAVLGGSEAIPLLADVAFLGTICAIPVVIAFAVVRRGLFDLDVIVRRTLVYTVLTGLLASVYLGSVIVLRSLIGGAIGIDSSVSVAASTLLAAALFSPARAWVRRSIDRRLFRSRYDAEQVLESFSRSLRDVTDLSALWRGVFGVVDTTVHPRSAGMWISETDTTFRSLP